ncbi:MAG: ubiquinol-cytochrome C chaperone family protein [Croceibacterium sp.]
MSLIERLLKPRPDPREALRPLWHGVVARSREPAWYRACGVVDTVPGRFDMVTAILALVLLRLEHNPETARQQALLTELFVEDMDGQLRQSGVGDLMVGKHIGKLVSALGGRLGAFRAALAEGNGATWREALARNVTLRENGDAGPLAERLYHLREGLAGTPTAAVLDGELPQ